MSNDEQFDDLEILENDLEDFAPNQNYREIRDDIVPKYFTPQINHKTGVPFGIYKHQKQAIAWSLQAEGEGPIIDDEGNAFYSRSGINALGTGMGKTLVGLGVSCYSVSQSKVPDNYLSTSLNFVKLKQSKRENISCTLIVGEKKIMNDAWLSDARKFYPELPYFLYESDIEFNRRYVESSSEYIELQHKLYQDVDTVDRGFVYYSDSKDKNNTDTIFKSYGIDFFLDGFDSPRSIVDMKKMLQSNFDKKIEDMRIEALKKVMSQVKVFFCFNSHFYTLFPFFKKYTMDRGIFDEPQNTIYINQDQYKEYLPDVRLRELKINGMGKMLPFYEESPFRFIWLYSATPHLIKDNGDNHYFNKWIAKNDYVLADYIRGVNGEFLFPKLVEKYVIKFPNKYVMESRPDYVNLVNNYVLKCAKSKRVQILKGAISDDIDQMLENDDYEGIVKKLGGTDVNTIFELAVSKLTEDIIKRENEIAAYSSKTNQSIRDNSAAELANMKRNLEALRSRISEMKNPDSCSICLDDFNYYPTDSQDLCLIHSNMGNPQECGCKFHLKCIVSALHVKMTCPNCRRRINNFQTDFTSLNSVTSENQNTNSKFYDNPDFIYDSKMDALKESLKAMKRTNPDGTESFYKRTKILLFVEAKDDSNVIKEITKVCQNSGYNVRLPYKPSLINPNTGRKTTAKDALKAAYPDITVGYERFEITFPGDKSKIPEEIDDFKCNTRPFVWIFRSGKESAGLNFPFIDTLIEYSKFKSHKQIIGRALRINRELPVDLIRIVNVDDEDL